MHEMSIALAVVGQVEDAARQAGAGAVRTVRLQVGELAGVVPDSLAFCFELACAGTVLEGAALETETVAGRARCAPCADEWPVGMPPDLCCPVCGTAAAELLAGRELRVTGVRWDDPADSAADRAGAGPASPSNVPPGAASGAFSGPASDALHADCAASGPVARVAPAPGAASGAVPASDAVLASGAASVPARPTDPEER